MGIKIQSGVDSSITIEAENAAGINATVTIPNPTVGDDATTQLLTQASLSTSQAIETGAIKDGAVTNDKIDTMAASKLTGALPAISGAALTGISAGTVVSAGAGNVVATGNRMIATFSAAGGDSSRTSGGTNSNDGGDGAGIQGAIFTVSSGETITVTIPTKGAAAAIGFQGQDGVSVTVTGSTTGSIATFGGGGGGLVTGATGTTPGTDGTSSGSSTNGRNYPGEGGALIAQHNVFNAGADATALIHGFFTV